MNTVEERLLEGYYCLAFAYNKYISYAVKPKMEYLQVLQMTF